MLHERTGGNPFYLGELVRLPGSEHRLDAAALGVPQSVREMIARRALDVHRRLGLGHWARQSEKLLEETQGSP
ncbi:hypothetical protein [Nonomuraea sp. NPDC050783]|uniref:hypothetical protein n=1 Tax=Nonomuraea sp. NPDC050783 TaxID=3154634 RepID=UPI003464FD73